ncbi:MAG: NAD/NADP octopine/nopaline dehydrogenase family protein [Burkholderiales bacterium]
MSAVAMVGAGAIARACAVLLARDGHTVALWSPRGRGAADLPAARTTSATWPAAPAATLVYTGVVEGTAEVALLDDPAEIASADVVVVALPAFAYPSVLPRIAPHLRTGQTVFVSGALSLAPLWLAELAAADGRHPLLAASGTTVATARSRDGGVAIMTIRTRLAVAALPASSTARAAATLTALFGDRFDTAANVLAVTLTNINPVAHAAMALANITRIERAEIWPQYHYLTPAVARLVEAMDAERRAVAAAFGLTVTTIEQHFQRSFDVPQAELAGIAAELHRRRGGPPGPTSLDTRFVLEDVPFGLACNAALARICGVAVPVTDATIRTLSALYGRDLAGENPLLAALGLVTATRASLLTRCQSTTT